jgi:hypothetical protein
MPTESSARDSLKTEKISLLVLAGCVAVLVAVLIFRPF